MKRVYYLSDTYGIFHSRKWLWNCCCGLEIVPLLRWGQFCLHGLRLPSNQPQLKHLLLCMKMRRQMWPLSDTQRIIGDAINSRGIVVDVIVIRYSTDGDAVDIWYSTSLRVCDWIYSTLNNLASRACKQSVQALFWYGQSIVTSNSIDTQLITPVAGQIHL